MKTIKYKVFTDDEYKDLYDWVLPVWDLLGDSDQQKKVGQWLTRTAGVQLTRDKMCEIQASMIALLTIMKKQTSKEFWEKTGLPHVDGLVEMRQRNYDAIFKINSRMIDEILTWDLT